MVPRFFITLIHVTMNTWFQFWLVFTNGSYFSYGECGMNHVDVICGLQGKWGIRYEAVAIINGSIEMRVCGVGEDMLWVVRV